MDIYMHAHMKLWHNKDVAHRTTWICIKLCYIGTKTNSKWGYGWDKRMRLGTENMEPSGCVCVCIQ